MTDWKSIYDGVFFISIATILAGSFGLAVRYCLKSKCEKFSICFGLFEIKRRVDLEVQEEMAQIEMGDGLIDEIITEDITKKNNNSPKPLSLPKLKRHLPEVSERILRQPHVNKEINLEEKEDNNV